MIKKIFKKEYLINFIFIFYIISIFLDLHIFYNSIGTLIRIVILGFVFLILYFAYANKKEKRYLNVYFIFLTIYLVFHLLHINTFINKEINYNICNEVLYFIKMQMSIIAIFIIYKLQISKKTFFQIISCSSFLISFIIIITNFFKLSYTAYDFNLIKFSFFDWFKYDDLSFLLTSSKGLFHLTNQIVAILVLYLPILLMHLKEKINVWKVLNVVFSILALFLLGTRVSTYSIFITIVITIVIYIATSIKEKTFSIKYCLVLITLLSVSFLIYPKCPLVNRNNYYNDLFQEKEIINRSHSEDITNKQENTMDAFKHHLESLQLPKSFYLNYYPVENDYDFYVNYINNDIGKMLDVRNLELSIIKRVKKLNNNNLDNFFGIGYDRIMNIFNIEIDYVMQYYAVGMLGLLFTVAIYIIIIIYLYFKILFNLKRYFQFDNLIPFFAITMFLTSAYFTGNILNSISCIIPISFVLGYFLNSFKYNMVDDEYYLGLKTTLLEKEIIIERAFKEKEQVILYNINPLICLNFRNNKKAKKAINKQKYNIPDGNGIVLASILTSNKLRKSLPGIEIMESICEKAIENSYSIYLYGSKQDNVKETKLNLEKKYLNINIIGYSNGYNPEDAVLKDIIDKKPHILFVALGSPKQEEFIIKNQKKLKDIRIIMPVGGSFDVLSGNLQRAPKTFRKLKMEWLYRMIKEPKRFKQVFKLVYFVLLVLFRNICYNEKE